MKDLSSTLTSHEKLEVSMYTDCSVNTVFTPCIFVYYSHPQSTWPAKHCLHDTINYIIVSIQVTLYVIISFLKHFKGYFTTYSK